jgi:hypothetical protein
MMPELSPELYVSTLNIKNAGDVNVDAGDVVVNSYGEEYLKIKNSPYDPVYYTGDAEPVWTGLQVAYVDKENNETVITDYTTSPVSALPPGPHVVTVTRGGLEAYFSIAVLGPGAGAEAHILLLTSLPRALVFDLDPAFVPGVIHEPTWYPGLVLTGVDYDGANPAVITTYDDYSRPIPQVTGFDTSSVGPKEITVTRNLPSPWDTSLPYDNTVKFNIYVGSIKLSRPDGSTEWFVSLYNTAATMTSSGAYKIDLYSDVELESSGAAIGFPQNSVVTMEGINGPRTITASRRDSWFSVERDRTFILGNNIILDGDIGIIYSPIIEVDEGTFEMLSGSVITNGLCRHSYNPGVVLKSSTGYNAVFNMKGGTISNMCTTGNGAGVFVGDNGFFNMTGGVIENNYGGLGGGVFLDGVNSKFRMSGDSLIRGNSTDHQGGGVYIKEGDFAIGGYAKIIENSAARGGGVHVAGGQFTLVGVAYISGNQAWAEIDGHGGGVYVEGGDFTMNGGTISRNTCTGYGGGVYVGGGVFLKRDFGWGPGQGIIGAVSGSQLDPLSNFAPVHGHAVSNGTSSWRNDTVGPSVTLSDTGPGWVNF